MGTLIDSSVFIAIERQRLARRVLDRDPDDPCAIAAITVSELWHGVMRADPIRRERRKEYVESIFANFPIIPFDADIAKTHGELLATLHVAGLSLGALDVIIAATAIHLDYKVLTLDKRSFAKIPGLECVVLSD